MQALTDFHELGYDMLHSDIHVHRQLNWTFGQGIIDTEVAAGSYLLSQLSVLSIQLFEKSLRHWLVVVHHFHDRQLHSLVLPCQLFEFLFQLLLLVVTLGARDLLALNSIKINWRTMVLPCGVVILIHNITPSMNDLLEPLDFYLSFLKISLHLQVVCFHAGRGLANLLLSDMWSSRTLT